jgi:serine/threonine protein kinase
MANEPTESESCAKRVDEVIAAFLALEDAGETLDPKKWIADHPDLRPELEEFFADHVRLGRLARPPGGAVRGEPAARDAAHPGRNAIKPYSAPPVKAVIRPGTKVCDRYEVIALIGSGGMGEVYRAKDTKIKRQVAIKVLPSGLAADAEHVHRFEQEARAAGALNHPNILAIYDIVEHEGSPCLIAELLEGQSLRARLAGTKLSPRKAVDYALQMAHGLAAAHAKNIVHRDLKPDNLFITQDGRLKILDFGLAKLTEPRDGSSPQETAGRSFDTDPGVLLGTVLYMSPEQVCGKRISHLSDIFTFGVIHYEMLSGRRVFRRDSTAETMSAILKEDPPELSEMDDRVPPVLARIVRRCLEKSPEERFQSASDLAFALEALSSLSESGTTSKASPPAPPRRRLPWRALMSAVCLAAAATVAFWAGKRTGETPLPVFQRLTHSNGVVYSARFTPDGNEVVYGASWDGKPVELYSTRPSSLQPQDLGIPADILAIAHPSEMAVSLGRHHLSAHVTSGTLAQVTLGANAPRALKEDVQEADWFPNGGGRLLVQRSEDVHRLLHDDRVVYETEGWISHARVSPDGTEIAFLDHPTYGDDWGSVKIVESKTGVVRRVSGEYKSAQGLAWSATGDEVWFTAAQTTNTRALYALMRSGPPRLVARVPGWLTLQDIALDGRVLLTHSRIRSGIIFRRNGESAERDLSWFDYSFSPHLSADGATLVFTVGGQGGGPYYSLYRRRTDGSDAALLGEGEATGLSPDGKWVLALLPTVPPRLECLPTGPGEKRRISWDGLTYQEARWFPDGERILI